MFTRLLTFKGATDIDGGVRYLREEVLPVLHAQHGYQGITASGDRSRNVLGILSLWETESDRAASDSALGKARQEAVKIVGGDLTVENLEQVVSEIARPIIPGCGLFVTRVSMDPSAVDANIEFFRNEIVPEIKSQPGFCGLRNMVDRATGRAVVGSAWENREGAERSLATLPERRARAEQRGVRFDETEIREILFAELK
jgi:heme-degrading monooxygenase HmoA